jgi:hypothetical protein
MSFVGTLREEANRIAAREHRHADDLYEDYKRAQETAERLKADHDLARTALIRLWGFRAKVNGEYQCAACWVEQNARATMLPRPGIPKGVVLECVECADWIVVTD